MMDLSLLSCCCCDYYLNHHLGVQILLHQFNKEVQKEICNYELLRKNTCARPSSQEVHRGSTNYAIG